MQGDDKRGIHLTICAVVENICGLVLVESVVMTVCMVFSTTLRCGLVGFFMALSAENFRFNSGDGGIWGLLLLGGFDNPTEPGKRFGRAEISFLMLSIACLASMVGDGWTSIV